MKIVEEIVRRTFTDDGIWLPPSEVQPLVLCKDCKFGITEMDDGIYFCKIPEHGCVGHTGKWFCADGRKKDGVDN